ncbi:DUF6311 domain-containing protein [Falsiroseomonas oryziterrae]|uniref:DUF6311 domain-containing protein n=1 Tax=Falsiroseomonas oryziterrae TaxID=2911368 RepID=UPI001F3540F5|nr:DUF6311 domain-containing protein [Roseomonas sp. NPKOSM-4]
MALALGVALVAWIFPAEFLFPAAGEAFRPVGDAAQHVIAQRYLIADAWRWPPTFAANLNTQEGGLNTAFADSIPLLALVLKALRGWLPEGFHGIGLFYGLAWALQPVAAVWALRGADERRLLPAIGVSLAAVSMPAFIGRFGHAALSGHFLILVGLGFYFRLVVEPTRGLWIGAALLQVAALLVHPYLALMTLALLAAVPATRLLRGERFLPEALGVAGIVALVAAVMAAFGYLGAEGDGGYGMFAMNLLSPLWPSGSALLGWPWAPQLDATGHGGWEGYNWLGLGVIAAIVAGTLLRPGAAAEAMFRAHPGLTLAAIALSILAASHRVGFGGAIILDLGEVPSFLEQFRASGRFFWPVGYALLIGAMILLARSFAPLVLVAGLIQFADAATLRGELSRWAAQHPAWTVEAPKLRAALAEARSLTILPSWPCIDKATGDATYAQLLEVLLLASERGVPASTMYAARWHEPPRCRDRELAAAPFAPGELRVILPAAQAALAPLVPGSDTRCAPIGELLACR